MRHFFMHLYSVTVIALVVPAWSVFAYAETRVGIYLTDSDFKTAVADILTEQLTRVAYTVDRHAMDALSADAVRGYDGIVILNETRWLQIDKRLKKFLDTIDDAAYRKLVILSTTGGKHRKVDIPGVDSVTSASENNKARDIAERMFRLVTDKIGAR